VSCWPLLAPVLAFVVAWGVTRVCCRPGSWLYFLDQPNERSLHVTPTPRTGGVGVMAGLLAGGVLVWVAGLGDLPLGAALAGAGGLALVGLADDRVGLSARLRLLHRCWWPGSTWPCWARRLGLRCWPLA
jgi:UDP-N-acetylmuramyl pentapeptide phosphotransferase/UDP-N-acetylglucosamine-1-phosphate transferase